MTVSRAAHKNRRNINYPKKQKKTKKKKKVYHFLSVLKYESCMSKSFFFLVEIYLFIFFVQCHKFFFLEMYVRGKKCRSLGLQQQPLSISAFQTKNQVTQMPAMVHKVLCPDRSHTSLNNTWYGSWGKWYSWWLSCCAKLNTCSPVSCISRWSSDHRHCSSSWEHSQL